jgi:predicted enzyme related to lactoylglutathione lyase
MLKSKAGFASFSVDDLNKAKGFYADTLGLQVTDDPMGILQVQVPNGENVMVYPKGSAHQAATFTVLNFVVDDIDSAVDELSGAGVQFEHYDSPDIKTDEKGIARDEQGPKIAWFKDPAGNIMSLLED